MSDNIDNMNVLFNVENFNNINVQNDCLLNVDPDHNHDFPLPNCIDVDPNDLLINQLSTTFSCLSLNIFSVKKHFLTLQTEITDNFRHSVIGLCEKIDSNIEQLYNLAGYNLITNNNQLKKGGLDLYIKSNIQVTIKHEQTFIRNGIKSIFTELTTTNGIIVDGLIYKRSVDISTENFSVALDPLISSLDPRVKTYIMSDFNVNLLDHNLSPPVENFINRMISKKYLPIINRPTRVTPHSCTLIDNIFCN